MVPAALVIKSLVFFPFQELISPGLWVLSRHHFLHHSTRGWGLENTTSSSTKLILGLIWVWALFVVVLSLVKPPLFGCTA